LSIVADMLPKENKVPANTYYAKKLIGPLTMGVEKIHACRNHCILYRGDDYKDLESYPKCGASRYKTNKNYREEECVASVSKGKKRKKAKKKTSIGDDYKDLESCPDFISLSETNSELSKKNKYHHLGTGGYKRQVSKWRQEDAEKKAAGLPTLSEQLGERTANWIRARKPRETESGVSFDDPTIEEAATNIYAIAAKQSQGTFKPQRERDILTGGLSNPEHPGRVRGISSKEGWKEGFGPQWEGLYKKRNRYKKEMANYFKEEAKKEFKGLMSKMLSNPPLELMQQLAMASAMSVQQMTTPQIQIIPAAQTSASTDTEGTTIPSSVASTGNKVRYPVDDIIRLVACTLVIRYGINNQRTKKVATGLAIPGCKFHGNNIPEEYCRVEVTTVVQGYEGNMLDIPGPEGIETLGQAIKNFILFLTLLLLILMVAHRLRHIHRPSGIHLLHSHLHDHQRNLKFLYQN
jgi:hypothetical protein